MKKVFFTIFSAVVIIGFTFVDAFALSKGRDTSFIDTKALGFGFALLGISLDAAIFDASIFYRKKCITDVENL